ncbi:LysE family translocator [Methylovirgula sp. 4M-Z18]|uniref:LysE family translocator n=1 Tax=Methylovirgula sp. 4M-Z18 TaxID=2293567 RepID=UPI000E2EF8A2|nr:LysE family translocator [Methylovirgula sp. 4M-Z18]RFB81261.1 LysE family translocator [Methylovirgula sp. 4M-Z18]
MSLPSLLLFASIYCAAVATPGPGIAAILARVLGHGLRSIAPFIAGIVLGDLIWFTIASLGLAVIAHTFAILFTAIKFAGVAYLLFLAWKMWRAPAASADAAEAPRSERGWRLFLGSLSLTLGNPKVIVFFLSIMPLVVDLDHMSPAVFAQMAGVMVCIITPVLVGYALAAERARRLFRSARAMKMINRGAAGVMAGVAVAIATRG